MSDYLLELKVTKKLNWKSVGISMRPFLDEVASNKSQIFIDFEQENFFPAYIRFPSDYRIRDLEKRLKDCLNYFLDDGLIINLYDIGTILEKDIKGIAV